MAQGFTFWTISYLQIVFYLDPVTAQTTYITVLLAALIPGVYLGAYLADLNGGYKGKGLAPALTICCIFAGFFAMFAIWDCYNFNYYFYVLLTWLTLLCGSAIMPIGQGIIVSCVPKFAQNSASSLYAIFVNLLGYTMAPVLSGYAAAQYENKRDGMISAYRVIFSAAPILFILYLLARAVAIRQISM